MIRSSLAGFFLLLNCYVQAQFFEWSAPVAVPTETGFYAIPLHPKAIAFSKEDLSDLRIFDGKGKEVPYLRRKDEMSFDKQFFTPYEKVSKEMVKGCCTRLTIENAARKEFQSLCLLIKNHDLNKTAVLRGSEDKDNWFAIREDISFSPIQNSKETFGASYVSFPLSNYAYFQLQINDSSSSPLNILEVGEYRSETELGKWDTIVSPQISQVDSVKSKMTFVKLVFDAPYAIEKMELLFGGPKFFSRSATLYTIEKDAQQKEWQQYVQSFQLSSKATSLLFLQGAKSTEYLIAIENGDNPPVRLASVVSSRLHTYLLTYLEKGESYSLKFGQKEAKIPQYDLSAFADSVPSRLPELVMGTIVHQDQAKEVVVKESFFQTKWWIWAAIGLVMGLLVWMSARMLKEMGSGS